MSVLQFLSSLVGSLAWPAIIVFLVVVFRGPLTALIGRLKSAKWGDKEAVFDRESEALQVNLDEMTLESSKVGSGDEPLVNEPASAEGDDGSTTNEPVTTPWSRWARDPQERYAKVASKWRHPSRSIPLQRRAAELAASGVPGFPSVDPPRFIRYLDHRDPTGSAAKAFRELVDWVEFVGSLLGADGSADAKRSLVHMAELASLDETKLLNAWRHLASMHLLLQSSPRNDQVSEEAIRFIRSVAQFAQTLFEAIEPGLDIVRADYANEILENGEDQAMQEEIDRRLDR